MQTRFGRTRAHGVRAGAATAVMAVAALAVPATGGAAAAPHRTGGATRAAARPGAVVGAQPSAFRMQPGVSTATDAWRIRYRSTDEHGRPNIVSGTVIVPRDGHTGTRPLVTYAVGTVGLADTCAPSATFPQGTTSEAALIAGALKRGWAVAVTDYEGLGTPGPHTYTVGRVEGTAVLDAARAAEHLPQARRAGVTGASPVGIMGYSQGGQASSWAAELADTYAPELHVKGTATGGVPADLPKVAAYNDGDPDAALVLMAAIGHDAAYPRLHLKKYLNDEGTALAKTLRSGCVAQEMKAGAGKSLAELTVTNPLGRPDWRRALAADRLGTRAPAEPVYLYQGTADEIIPYQVGEQLRERWCSRDATVQWQAFPLTDHVTTAVLGSGPAMNWLGARFAGAPTHGNCG
jgi:fermentation-respiration switch protein FrsA (DUF1100 family)